MRRDRIDEVPLLGQHENIHQQIKAFDHLLYYPTTAAPLLHYPSSSTPPYNKTLLYSRPGGTEWTRLQY